MTTIVPATPVERLKVPPLPTAESCVIVIFGASGDLTRRKLVPALYQLACAGCMHKTFEVLGVARTPMTSEKFRERMSQSMNSHDAKATVGECWSDFEKRLSYFTGDPNDFDFYPKLKSQLETMAQSGGSRNWLFYVSTPATVAAPIIRGLQHSGLNRNEHGWSRIVLEKPFGRDLESARALNQTVLQVFEERNVYRIDHYLGKETVQNMAVFRFGNSVFEPLWNRNYVDHVEITATEMVGIEGRAAFYEETGALRDMVANHLLQLLALTAMDPPVAFDAESVREEKVQVFRSIRPMTVNEVAERTVRGQYGPGEIDGKSVPGYRQEPGVNANSTTETFVALEFHVDNWRWAGVPFYVSTGKRLGQVATQVKVQFKRTPQALFARTPDEQLEPNLITLGIQPDEGISIAFAAKRPGSQMQTVTVRADFSYESAFGAATPPAYATLLLDAMRGDPTLFTRGDEVEAEWRIITPIEEAWAELPAPAFPNYAAGSDGPQEAAALVRGEHRVLRIARGGLERAA